MSALTKHTWARAIGVLILVLGGSARAAATPILTPTVSEQSNGLFEYSYVLTNPFDSGETIFDLGLFFSAGETVTDALAPDGWLIFPLGPGFIDWQSGGFSADLAPGASLSGFSFLSRLAPAAITFQTVEYRAGGDPFDTSFFNGETLGPMVEPRAVPEPATLWLVASGVVLVSARARRRR